MNPNPVCFYHSADLDGICSGAIAKHFIPNIELIGYDYGKPFPWDKVEGRVVYMVDVSLPIDEMVRLEEEAERFVWIDHHKSAIDKMIDHSVEFEGIQEVGRAGCELMWQMFLPEAGFTPTVVYFLGRYDVWDRSDSRTLPFQYGMRLSIKEGVEDPLWKTLFEPGVPAGNSVNAIIEEGELILRYQMVENEKYARACAFDAELEGLKLIAINKGLANSQLFDSVWDPEVYDAMAMFYLNKRGQWKVSLYSTRDDVDVSEVCKKLGGGGHKGAAGFISDTCPFVKR